MHGGKIWWIGFGVAALLALSGCSDGTAKAKERSMVRGTTPLPAALLFTCDDGASYETRSRPYGDSLAHFSLSLPREAVCQLWIKRGLQPLRRVVFHDDRGNLSSLVYLKNARIDLGRIREHRHDAVAAVTNDDILLVAGDERIPETTRTPERLRYFGELDREEEAAAGS
jgi:hypothetical protein